MMKTRGRLAKKGDNCTIQPICGVNIISANPRSITFLCVPFSPEHDDGGICQRHLLNSVEEQDHGIGTDETPKHQKHTFISGTEETCPGGAEI